MRGAAFLACRLLPLLLLCFSLLLLSPCPCDAEPYDAPSALYTAAREWDFPGQMDTWTAGSDPCDEDEPWHGVVCSEAEDGASLVTALDLSYQSIVGKLPDSWGQWLTDLVSLNISHNMVTGPLPESWSGMIHMHTLKLENNRISGQFPQNWTAMESLAYMDLSDNQLTGTLVDGWKERDAFYFDFSSNHLRGTVPDVYGHIGLSYLYLTGNTGLCGELGSAQSIAVATDTHLGEACVASPPPPEFRDRPPPGADEDPVSRTLLDIKKEWDDPEALSDWDISTDHCSWRFIYCDLDTETERIKLSFILDQEDEPIISGTLPKKLADIPHLRELDLSSARNLRGTLPPEWSKLTDLETLVIDGNILSGSLPGEWHSMKSLLHLSLQRNMIGGSIPGVWSSKRTMSNLHILNLCVNKMDGMLPPIPFNPHISQISLCNNSFGGPLPRDWSSLKALQVIDISYNKVTGNLPDQYSSLSELRTLDVSHNEITGLLPESWPSGMPALQTLTLDHNEDMCGGVPEGYTGMHITISFVDTNLIVPCATDDEAAPPPPAPSPPSPHPPQPPQPGANRPPVPADTDPRKVILLESRSLWRDGARTLSTWTLEGKLCMDWNAILCDDNDNLIGIEAIDQPLNGPLPSEWSALTGLETITLLDVGMTGTLPPSWGELTNLREITVATNSDINGTLPESWSKLKRLLKLDVSSNVITGSYPAVYSNLANLAALSMRHNKITGDLPEVPAGPNIKLMEFYDNQFVGTLPAAWSTYTSLGILNVGNNHLITGTLPDEWRALTRLREIFLSNSTQLHGIIPPSWTQLTLLAALYADDIPNLCGPEPKWETTPPPKVLFRGTAVGEDCPQPTRINPPEPPGAMSAPPARPRTPTQALATGRPPLPPGAVRGDVGSSGGGGGGLSGGAIAGIVIGSLVGGALLALVVLLLLAQYMRKRRGTRYHSDDPGSYDHALFGEGTRTVGLAPSDALYSAPVPTGGGGMHSRGHRSRGFGSSVSSLVSSMLNPGSRNDEEGPSIPLSQMGREI